MNDTNRVILEAKTAATAQMKALLARGKSITLELGHGWSQDDLFVDRNDCEMWVTGVAM